MRACGAGTRGRAGTLGIVASLVGVATMIVACDDPAAKLRKAAESLAGYEVESPPNATWKLIDVRAVGSEKVVMRVRIDPGTEAAFGSVGRIQQSRISQRACPSGAAKVWSYLGEEQSLWVEMVGSGGVVVEALCKA